MEHFCRAWAPTYDLVFFTRDHYDQPSDGFRVMVVGLQETAATTLRTLYGQLDVAVIDVPLGLETDQRVEWVARRVADSGVVVTR